jgi:hypothetical protein
MTPIVADPCPPTAPLCPIGPHCTLSHPLTHSCTPDKPHETILNDTETLPNITKEIVKEIAKERMTPIIVDPCTPTAQLCPIGCTRAYLH